MPHCCPMSDSCYHSIFYLSCRLRVFEGHVGPEMRSNVQSLRKYIKAQYIHVRVAFHGRLRQGAF